MKENADQEEIKITKESSNGHPKNNDHLPEILYIKKSEKEEALNNRKSTLKQSVKNKSFVTSEIESSQAKGTKMYMESSMMIDQSVVQPKKTKIRIFIDRVKFSMSNFLENNYFVICMSLLTVYVLFADDIRILSSDKVLDNGFYIAILVCFGIFICEIILSCCFKRDYICSFFFWLDIISTFSILLDVGWFNDLIFNNSAFADYAKIGRASRIGARASKIVRIIRIIRLIRIIKLYKHAQKAILEQEIEHSSKRVSEINSKNMKKKMEQHQKLLSLNDAPSGLKSPSKSQNNKIPFENPANENNSKLPLRHNSTIHSQISKDMLKSLNDTEASKENDASKTETQVGRTLTDRTTKKVILMILAMLFSNSIFSYDTYFNPLTCFEGSLENIYYWKYSKFNEKRINDAVNHIVNAQNDRYPILTISYVENADNKTSEIYSSKVKDEDIRSTDILTYTLDKYKQADLFILVDNRFSNRMEAYFNIGRTIFVLFVLAISAFLFSRDANELVLIPIENMMSKIKRIARNPLEAARIEEDEALAEEQLKAEDKNNKRLNVPEMETTLIERTIIKIGALLAIGFGEAGSEIIETNLTKTGSIDPMIPGRKVAAIFGFCDIRNFTDATEVLQEKVMIFVNEIAEIVHGTADSFHGAANKNIGDAFLMVWKIPRDLMEVTEDNNLVVVNSPEIVSQLADMSLMAFIKIILELKRSQKIFKYSGHKGLQKRIPNYSVKMGFGLHIGWAIEGAIGSRFKIDASYLSPNVNMASRLEAATKQFGTQLLFSGALHQFLDENTKRNSRMIDRVTVKGSLVPIDLYTCDLDLTNLKPDKTSPEELIPPNRRKIEKFLSKLRRKDRFLKVLNGELKFNGIWTDDPDFNHARLGFSEEFYNNFKHGINNYIKGDWTMARMYLEKARIMVPSGNDGPSATILGVLEAYNYKSPPDWKGFRELTEK